MISNESTNFKQHLLNIYLAISKVKIIKIYYLIFNKKIMNNKSKFSLIFLNNIRNYYYKFNKLLINFKSLQLQYNQEKQRNKLILQENLKLFYLIAQYLLINLKL